ncbi:unnamed protein product [Rotaria sordida]|uniref:Uncharacterized protein n=2 Tax=Rotaria sordida TaxID=392033 RepID=A0A819FJ53_9BILA|nr:unnamed protein product [Rotaria sordida]CAF1397647.1 unnamed protein product [Rotaria sordida]CAF1476037.1 unnamed protein product [Rotaria sordida]CAF3869420.1 unnamed protein product [Rotaria sordida]CAF4247339.1 unnamed protein product [Rotaria sordida]
MLIILVIGKIIARATKNAINMQQQVFLVVITLTILLVQHCQSHSEQQPKGFPKQFVAILNQTSYLHWKDSGAPEQLVYDFINQRARFDIKG